MGAVISQTGEDLNVTNWPTFFNHGSFFPRVTFDCHVPVFYNTKV